MKLKQLDEASLAQQDYQTGYVITLTDDEGWTQESWGVFKTHAEAANWVKAVEKATGVAARDMSNAQEPIMILAIRNPHDGLKQFTEMFGE